MYELLEESILLNYEYVTKKGNPPTKRGVFEFDNEDELKKALEPIHSAITTKLDKWDNLLLIDEALAEGDRELNPGLTETLKERINALGGDLANLVKNAIKNSNVKELNSLIKNTNPNGIPSEPKVGEAVEVQRYDIPASFLPVANYKLSAGAGTAQGRGEILARIMFGHDDSKSEPDVVVPGVGGFAVKQLDTPSSSVEPGAAQEAYKFKEKISGFLKGLKGKLNGKLPFTQNAITLPLLKELETTIVAQKAPKMLSKYTELVEKWSDVNCAAVGEDAFIILRRNTLFVVPKNQIKLKSIEFDGKRIKIYWPGAQSMKESSAMAGGAISGVQVPLGRGPDGKPATGDSKSKKKILSKNAKVQGQSWGNAKPLNLVKPIQETRNLLWELLFEAAPLTVGDVKTALKYAKGKKLDAAKSAFAKRAAQVGAKTFLSFVPGLGGLSDAIEAGADIKDIYDAASSLKAKDKKKNPVWDKLSIDPGSSSIVDDGVETQFLKDLSDKIEIMRDDEELPDVDTQLANYLKDKFDGSHIAKKS